MYLSRTLSIGIIGYGFVGKAVGTALSKRNLEIVIYDKFNDQYQDFKGVLATNMIFVAVPTPSQSDGYDLSALNDVISRVADANYCHPIVIKSTIPPGTTKSLHHQYPKLHLIHNPEFLTARTANEDFETQAHIILGESVADAAKPLVSFYADHFPKSKISVCSSDESELVKICCNSFYGCKVQIFTEFYLLCQHLGADYNRVKDLMLSNGWINPMHTTVPGPDGNISFGGMCFPKDLQGLISYMRDEGLPHSVLEATLNERNQMRKL